MGLIDSLKALVGAGGARVQLDEPAAEGSAEAAVAALAVEVKQAIALELREGSSRVALDAVLKTADLEGCTELLTSAFGAPKKPFGARPASDKQLTALIDSQGGIDTGQCLYLRRFADDRIAFAALWPWSNGVQITLKLGVYAEA